MKQNIFKKISAGLLAFMMTLSLMPVTSVQASESKTVTIMMLDNGGKSLADSYTEEVTVGTSITAPSVKGYYPNRFFSYGVDFKGGRYNSEIGSFEIGIVNGARLSSAEIETFSGTDMRIIIYYSTAYPATIINGEGSGDYALSETVTITADTVVGKQFKEWTVDR